MFIVVVEDGVEMVCCFVEFWYIEMDLFYLDVLKCIYFFCDSDIISKC